VYQVLEDAHAVKVLRMRAEALQWTPVRQIVELQGEDGSFPGRDGRGRAEATVNALHLMARCGMRAGDDPVDRALAYIEGRHTFQGAYSWVNGGSGVLPCYVGLFAHTLIRLAGAEAAASQLSWICDHQRFDHRDRLHLIDVLEALSMADPSLGEEDWVAEAMQTVESTLLDGKVPLVKNYPSKLVDPIPFEAVGQPSRFLTLQWLLVKRRFGLSHA